MTSKPSPWVIGRRWLVVRCAPRSEPVAAAKARELGYEVLFLHSTYMKPVQKRKPRLVIEPYIPGYIFAADDRRISLHALSKAQGVSEILTMAGEIITIPDTDSVMRHLLTLGDNRGKIEKETAKNPITLFKVGERVEIKNGPFALQKAVIESIDEKRQLSWMWVEVFGGRVRLQAEISHLAKVA